MTKSVRDLLELLIAEFWERGLQKLTQRDASFHKIPNKVHVVLGMRRSGKTCFLHQEIHRLINQGIPQNRILYLQFDDERILPISGVQMGQIVDAFYSLYPQNHDEQCFLFFDEVQNIADWSITIRRLLDTKKAQIYLSGSSAKLLSKEITTSLRGRSLATEIFPFSFQEYQRHLSKQIPSKPRSPRQRDFLRRELEQFLLNGGFPEIMLPTNAGERRQVLQEYLNVTIYRDIVERHGIQNMALLKYFVRTLIHAAGSSFTVNKCFNDLKSQGFAVGKDTLHDYLGFTNDCYLIFPMGFFSDSFRKKNVNPRKIYAVDTGLVCANTIWSSPPWGRLFENLVFLDLKRYGHNVSYYLTKDDGFEIDFVATSKKGRQKLYQVCWNLQDKTTQEREERALKIASKELGIQGEMITPQNYFDFIESIKVFG